MKFFLIADFRFLTRPRHHAFPFPGARTTALHRLFFAFGETVPVSLPVLKHIPVPLLLKHPV